MDVIMSSDIKIESYSPEFKQVWNDFVESSKNGTFLFNRDYMEYHSDRFHDNSYLFYWKGKLICLLPACITGDCLSSHAGLTYGGLILNDSCTAEIILLIFEKIISESIKKDIKKIIYKPIPHIYHTRPSEEDLYALFRNKALLTARNISSTIFQSERLAYSTLRKRMIKKSYFYNLEVRKSSDFNQFWNILTANLKERYNKVPVHSLQEISHLHNLFPDNIQLYASYKDGEMVAGVLIYISRNVVHAQYIAANQQGKEMGGLDAVFNFLIEHYKDIPYFDFGISTEDCGKYLNESLIHQKEGFGARAICYDTYELIIDTLHHD